MAFEGGISKLSLNSDAASVIDLLNGESLVLSEVRLLVGDIMDLMRRFNRVVLFSYSSRSANRVVHSIAKLTLNNSCHVFWVDDCHPSLRNLIFADSISSL
ncbi:hypothetical protein ACOSP7_005279 [Xanthoceras sorbifolium]